MGPAFTHTDMQLPLHVVAVGLNHRTAPLEVRERYAIPTDEIAASLSKLAESSDILEAAVLSTCNRVEIYAAGAQAWQTVKAITCFLKQRAGNAAAPESGFYIYEYPASVRHLYEVTSGLDSMVVGETEILGQVKESYRMARETGRTGVILNRLFQTAFSVAKDIRSSTRLGMGSVSVGSVAVDLAAQIFGDLSSCKALLIGAGETSELTARALRSRGVRSLIVTNRSDDHAAAMSKRIEGEFVSWRGFHEICEHVNIVISSTASELPVITREQLRPVVEKRRGRPLFLIDIAVPRDIEREVNQLDGVYLYDIDDLQVIADRNLALRQKEIATCKQIVRDHEDKFMAWFAKRMAGLPSVAVSDPPPFLSTTRHPSSMSYRVTDGCA